jgi:hypothetical protein
MATAGCVAFGVDGVEVGEVPADEAVEVGFEGPARAMDGRGLSRRPTTGTLPWRLACFRARRRVSLVLRIVAAAASVGKRRSMVGG